MQSLALTQESMAIAKKEQAAELRLIATTVSGSESFAEVAAWAIAQRFLMMGRKKDAKNLLASYLRYHHPTRKIMLLYNKN